MHITQPILAVSFLGDLPVHATRARAGAFGGISTVPPVRGAIAPQPQTMSAERKWMIGTKMSNSYLVCLCLDCRLRLRRKKP